MDSHNLFLTRTTYRLLRAEYAVALIGSIVLAVVHLGGIRWPAFIGLFVYIDLIGYLPGALAYRRAHGGAISRGYYLLYNSMHSLLSAGCRRRPVVSARPAGVGAAGPADSPVRRPRHLRQLPQTVRGVLRTCHSSRIPGAREQLWPTHCAARVRRVRRGRLRARRCLSRDPPATSRATTLPASWSVMRRTPRPSWP